MSWESAVPWEQWAPDLKVQGGSSSQLAGDTGQKDPVAQDISEQKFMKQVHALKARHHGTEASMPQTSRVDGHRREPRARPPEPLPQIVVTVKVGV